MYWEKRSKKDQEKPSWIMSKASWVGLILFILQLILSTFISSKGQVYTIWILFGIMTIHLIIEAIWPSKDSSPMNSGGREFIYLCAIIYSIIVFLIPTWGELIDYSQNNIVTEVIFVEEVITTGSKGKSYSIKVDGNQLFFQHNPRIEEMNYYTITYLPRGKEILDVRKAE